LGGYLVEPKSISVPLEFQRDGIAYDQLSDKEKEEWDGWNGTKRATFRIGLNPAT
jgi:type I site-specific restriction endonuclease